MDTSSAWVLEMDDDDDELMTKIFDSVDDLATDQQYSLQTLATFEEQTNLDAKVYSSLPQDITTITSSNKFTISFGDVKSQNEIITSASTKSVRTMIRNPFQADDHVLAERKRREKLNERFVSLTALLPNLRKTDKASVLEVASNYIKELEGRVKELEELSGFDRQNIQESAVSDITCDGEIQVQMSGSSVLVRIECSKHSNPLVKVLMEMQKIGLSFISSNSMPFADTCLLIIVIAQMENDFCMTASDLLKNLQVIL